jgi:peptidoglycan/LPS O-acetylase OafA/YrhL
VLHSAPDASVVRPAANATASIDLRRFYGRRLLRLAPALSVLVASVFLATHVLFPELRSSYLQGRWAAAALF